MRLLSTISTGRDQELISYLQAGLVMLVLILSASLFTTAAHAGNGYILDQDHRAMVANPDNFKRIYINGRGVSEAMAPCPITMGLINCALDKLALINPPVSSIHDDYDLLQVFYYPSTEGPNTAVVIAQATGLMDDSVSGKRYRVSFTLEESDNGEATWNFVQYGQQNQCARGNMAGEWINKNCV